MSTTETDIDRNREDEAHRRTDWRDDEGHSRTDWRTLQHAEPQAIEREIDATRADMRATLEALERRLSFDRLMEHTVGRIRERGGEFAGNLTDAATQNPVPLLLTSIGLGWMMLAGRSESRPYAGEGHGRMRERMDHMRDRASHAADRMHDAVDSTRSRLKGAADSSRETLEHTAESLRGGASRAASATREHAEHARQSMERLLEEQPLLLGAFGLAAGAIIGAMLPTTEHEDRWLGDARDKTLKRAVESGKKALDSGQERDEASGEQTTAYSSAPAGSSSTGEEGRAERPGSRPH